MTPDPEREMQELIKANCDLCIERERLLARIETLKADARRGADALAEWQARAVSEAEQRRILVHEIAAMRWLAQLEARKE